MGRMVLRSSHVSRKTAFPSDAPSWTRFRRIDVRDRRPQSLTGRQFTNDLGSPEGRPVRAVGVTQLLRDNAHRYTRSCSPAKWPGRTRPSGRYPRHAEFSDFLPTPWRNSRTPSPPVWRPRRPRLSPSISHTSATLLAWCAALTLLLLRSSRCHATMNSRNAAGGSAHWRGMHRWRMTPSGSRARR